MYSWILRVSVSKTNYWATYVVDAALMLFFLAWDASVGGIGAAAMTGVFALGVVSWTLSEYIFHRWVYHLDFGLLSHGHDQHHNDPTGYVAMPWFVTPILFMPIQQLLSGYYGVAGASTFLAGWFGGFIAYSFMHHSLHHYKLPFGWYRHLQSQHRIHHAFPETNFGVTMRLWDRVFRTEFTKPGPQ